MLCSQNLLQAVVKLSHSQLVIHRTMQKDFSWTFQAKIGKYVVCCNMSSYVLFFLKRKGIDGL